MLYIITSSDGRNTDVTATANLKLPQLEQSGDVLNRKKSKMKG